MHLAGTLCSEGLWQKGQTRDRLPGHQHVYKTTWAAVCSADNLMTKIIPTSRWYAKLDAIHGYFQVPLEDESTLLMAFLLPDGKRIYLVAPMGLVSSSDEFNIRSSQVK